MHVPHADEADHSYRQVITMASASLMAASGSFA
jgi:hypothetical protein